MSNFVYQLAGHLRIGGAGSPIGGQRIALLEQIEASGSISAAARAVGISYKGAWDAVNAMNNLAAAPLVTGSSGGAGGGGSVLSARGHQLVRIYRAAADEQARFIQRLNQRVDYLQDDLDLIGRLAMRTSARNQFLGEIIAIRHSSINAEVEIELPGGATLTAIITQASAANLGLEPRMPITALIKASWVIVAAGDHTNARLSTRNRLAGTVDRISTDAVNAEILIRLSDTTTLAAIITRESAAALGLASGDTATALFKASSVILANPD